MNGRPSFAWRWVLPVASANFVLLLAMAAQYGYHRDELYFRVAGRHPALGYDDQPPLTPLLARLSEELFGESPRGLRVVAALAMALAVVLVALIARELGARARGQLVASAATGASTIVLALGHIVSTATFDLLVWVVIVWLVVRILCGGDARLWLAVGVAAGLGLQNKHLVLLLLTSLGIGVVAARSWEPLRTRWFPIGALAAFVVWLPNLAWQASNGWPQLELGGQITDEDPIGARLGLVPFQLVAAGLLLAPIAAAGLWWFLRREEARRVRAIGYAYVALIGICLATGAKPYYPAALTICLFAPGGLVIERWLGRRGRGAMTVVVASIGVTACLSAVTVLPVVPARHLGATPATPLNEVGRESVGWQALTGQVRDVWRALPATERRSATIFTANYGEHGALAKYGPALGLPRAYSGHNAVWRFGRPSDDAAPVIVVGYSDPAFGGAFVGCRRAVQIDNGLDVENEEQGAIVWLCEGTTRPWSKLWPDLRHLNA